MSEEFAHYGIKGMKWGVRKEYEPHPRERTVSIEHTKAIGKRAVGELITKARRTVAYDYYRVNGKKYLDTVISKGTSFQRVTVNADEKLDRMYAVYKNEDKNLYKGRLGYLRKHQTGAPVYVKNFTAKRAVKAPSDKKSEQFMRILMDKDKDFSNYVKSLKDSGFNRVSKNPKNDYELYKNFNLAGIMDQSENGRAQAQKYYKLLKRNGYNAITDLNDRKYSTFKADNPVILFDMKDFVESSVHEISNKEIVKSLSIEQLRRTGGPFTMVALKLSEKEYGGMSHSDEFAHYGVKGMKWGVRKKRQLNPLSRQKKAMTSDQNYKKKDYRNLTNEELQSRITRLNLEKQYTNLYSEVRSPVRSKALQNAGFQFVNQALVSASAATIAAKVTKPYVENLLDKLYRS